MDGKRSQEIRGRAWHTIHGRRGRGLASYDTPAAQRGAAGTYEKGGATAQKRRGPRLLVTRCAGGKHKQGPACGGAARERGARAFLNQAAPVGRAASGGAEAGRCRARSLRAAARVARGHQQHGLPRGHGHPGGGCATSGGVGAAHARSDVRGARCRLRRQAPPHKHTVHAQTLARARLKKRGASLRLRGARFRMSRLPTRRPSMVPWGWGGGGARGFDSVTASQRPPGLLNASCALCAPPPPPGPLSCAACKPAWPQSAHLVRLPAPRHVVLAGDAAAVLEPMELSVGPVERGA